MSKFLSLAAAVGLSVGGASAVVPVVQGKQIANHLGEQHLHAALKATHAAAKAGNTQAARIDAQTAIQALHAAAKAFDQHHKASGGKTGTRHHTHPHIQAAPHDLQAAEKKK